MMAELQSFSVPLDPQGPDSVAKQHPSPPIAVKKRSSPMQASSAPDR